MTDRFRILLNRISAQLSEKDIRSLVHMCKIPECQRARMKDGISLFDNLMKRDIINENKLDSLKKMLKNLNPKRRDLIKEIQNFENGTEDDAYSTLTSVVSSVPSIITPPVSSSDVKSSCCTLECPCMMVSCYKSSCEIPYSYVLAAAFFLTCFLLIVLFWYANVPKVSEAIASDEHVKESGPFILCGIIVLFLVCLLSICFMKKRHNRGSNRSALSAGNEKVGMQKVQEEYVTESRDVKRASKRKTKHAGITNVGFSRHVHGDEASDSGTEDIDTDEVAVSREQNSS